MTKTAEKNAIEFIVGGEWIKKRKRLTKEVERKTGRVVRWSGGRLYFVDGIKDGQEPELVPGVDGIPKNGRKAIGWRAANGGLSATPPPVVYLSYTPPPASSYAWKPTHSSGVGGRTEGLTAEGPRRSRRDPDYGDAPCPYCYAYHGTPADPIPLGRATCGGCGRIFIVYE